MKAATLTFLRKEAYLIGHGRDKQQQCKIPRLLTHSPEIICDPAPTQVNSQTPSNLVLHLPSKSAHENNPYDNGRCAVVLKLFSSWRYCEFALSTEPFIEPPLWLLSVHARFTSVAQKREGL